MKWLPRWRTVLSACLIVFAFPPWNFWPLIWICLIPWFQEIQRSKTPWDAGIQGIWLSYFMSLGGFYWVAFVLREFGNVPWSLSILGLQGFCIIGQPQLFITAILRKNLYSRLFRQRSAGRTLLLTVSMGFFYVGIDWIVPKLFLDTLGNAFYLAKHMRQLADIGGASLLTFLLYIVNDALWNITTHFKEKGRNAVLTPQTYLAAGLCLIGWTYGYFRYEQIQERILHPKSMVNIAAIQANIGDFDKIAAERGVTGAATKVIDQYIDLTHQALQLEPKPDMIVWPETSYPSTFGKPHSQVEFELDQRVSYYAKQIDTPLLFGGYDRLENKDFNAFFFLGLNNELQVYRKNILLLFGEYIPGAETFQFIKDAFPQVGNFGRGKGPEVFTIATRNSSASKVKIGPIICYEALFPNYVAEAARKGSEVILNITNDSWFGPWGEPQLHLALTVFRSIESRLPMVRATNTGISTLVAPDGELIGSTEIGKQQILNAHVPLIEPLPSLMKSWGDWFGIFALIVGLMGLGATREFSFRKPASK